MKNEVTSNHSELSEFAQAIQVSLFENCRNPRPIGVVGLLEFLTTSAYHQQIMQIRGCEDAAQRRELKSQLPAITPSGIFSKRSNAGLIHHSSVVCIDIDGKDNPAVTDFEMLKSSLSDVEGCFYTALSASGNGVFLLIRIADPERHAEHFKAIAEQLAARGIVADAACKDVSRLRGATYDPNPYINPDAGIFTSYSCISRETSGRNGKTSGRNAENHGSIRDQSVINPDHTETRIGYLVQTIERTGANIADYYPDWYAIGCSLAAEFGERGRDYYHAVSRQSSKYNPQECDRQYSRCLNGCSKTSIRTFFYHCKRAGITTARGAHSG